MLLHTLLALVPLLNGTPAPAAPAVIQDQSPSLAWLIPDDAFMAVRWNDPQGILENDKESAWVSFMMDPRWLELDFIGDIPISEEDKSMLMDNALPILKASAEIVFWLEVESGAEPDLYAMIRTSEKAMADLAQIALTTAESLSEGNLPFAVDEGSAMTWSQGVGLLFIGEDPKGAMPNLASILNGFHTQTKPAGIFETSSLGSDRNDEHLEAIVNLGAVFAILEEEGEMADMPEPLQEEFDALQWMYMSCSFGEDENFDLAVVMPYLDGGYMDHLFSFAGAADMNAFSRVPTDAMGAAVGNFDLSGAIEWALEIVIEEGLTTEEEIETSILEMEETIGVHIFDDLINHMTGDYLQVLFPTETYDKEMQSMVALSYGLIIMGVSDTEEVEAALASLMEVAAMAVPVEEQDNSWGTVWGIDVMGMFDVQIGTNSDSMFLSAHPDAMDMFEAHRTAGPDSPSFKTLPGAVSILEELEGSYAYLYRTATLFEMIPGLFEDMPEFGDDPDLAMFLEVFEMAAEIAGDRFTGLIGTSVSFDGRLRSKTIAR